MPDFPDYVGSGLPITSDWGNDVVYTLGGINVRLNDNICGGYASVTSTVDGYVTIAFPITFANPPLIVATLTADTSAVPARVITIQEGGVTTTQFTARIYNSDSGSAIVNTPVNVNWIAFVGWLHA